MNAACGYLWLLSAFAASVIYYWRRRRFGYAIMTFFFVLTFQTLCAFAILGLISSFVAYPTREAVMNDWMGPALAISVPVFWIHMWRWKGEGSPSDESARRS